MIVYFHESFQSKDRILPVLGSYTFSHYRNTRIPNIHALNSDTNTLFLSILILSSQCVGVAIEGMDIWDMGITIMAERAVLMLVKDVGEKCMLVKNMYVGEKLSPTLTS